MWVTKYCSMYHLEQMLVGFSSIIQVHCSHTNIRNYLLHYRMFAHHLRRLVVQFQASYGK